MPNKMIKGILISCVLSYFFIKTDDTLTRIVLCPFIVYGVAFSLTQIFIMCGKKSVALKFKKIYEVAFFIYLFGFLICWDIFAIINKDYGLILPSIIMWAGGIFFVYRRFFRKK